MRNKLLIYSFIAVILLGLVQWVATFFYLYWTVWWFDNITHFLGGLAVGLFSFWILKQLYIFKQAPSFREIIFITIFLVLIVGFGWEIFESLNGIAFDLSYKETYWQDINYDIVADLLGAILAGYIIFEKRLHE